MRTYLSLISAPAAECLTSAEVKAHVRYTDTDQDTLITRLISAARVHVEGITGRALITQTWKLFLDYLPSYARFDYLGRVIETKNSPLNSCILLPKAPLQVVSSLKYYDVDGNLQTFSSSNYWVSKNFGDPPAGVDPFCREGELSLKSEADWPEIQERPYAVQIEFKAGYGDASTAVPSDLIVAMLELIAHWFENRESVVITATGTVSAVEVPQTIHHILAPYMIYDFGG